MLSITASPFYYVRHGQTDWNLERRCMGQQDIPLNITGVNQAHDIQSLFENTNIKTICHSPLMRATQTADILNEVLNCPMISITNLQECCWGVLEGTFKGNNEFIQKWMFSGKTPPGAESYNEFLQRATAGINEALSYPGPVLIVAHGGVYWAVLKAMHQNHDHHSTLPNCLPMYHQPSSNGTWLIRTLAQNNKF